MTDRYSIYDLIEVLKRAQTVQELRDAIAPILERLAYDSVVGDGAVLETNERWHTEYTDALYAEAGASRAAGDSHGGGHGGSGGGHGGAHSGGVSRHGGGHSGGGHGGGGHGGGHGGGGHSGGGHGGGGHGGARARSQQMPARPAASSIPASLRAIMEGNHPTLTEKD